MSHLHRVHTTFCKLRHGQGQTPLHLSAALGHEVVSHILVVYRANVDATNYRGDTPLHLSAKSGHIGVSQLLIMTGANIDAANNLGRRPLDYAKRLPVGRVVVMLLQQATESGQLTKGAAQGSAADADE
mmetsp:Transcript_59851/g.141595  ORF Transcript_59851/g.141595 Transcript_59851/m.141595 type:complete len:129 (-) Transcript_59851:26-412(-)|eukprot:CAMPEP_0175926286 /NCGR_PEP_ID=MMETSP0108-20121206/16099_1 /TAXON_ID=195067 ORGANISM="Goniomonas pacifica, Strain CCMP1869" /NCGR_SAMPLE_ID=MMETSP0108 /ASSEMBLY_ACC=CAM_ASM_000204 /LENGTH=128 /DNA_ID=CAMNT_0017249495 /DNA_START=238 /DNA_END=624 /DNA_ORIENTATION=-